MSAVYLFSGSVFALLGVVFGAFGAHALKARIEPSLMAVYQTAVQYQFYHAFALLFAGFALAQYPTVASFRWAGIAFIVGIVLFSGSLYALTLTNTRGFGAITPLGGVAWIVGWAAMAIGAWQTR